MITANNLRNQPSAVFVFGTPHGALTRYLYEILLRRNATLRVYHPTASGVEKAAFHHVRTIAIAAEPDLPTEGLAEMVQTARRLGIHFCAVRQQTLNLRAPACHGSKMQRGPLRPPFTSTTPGTQKQK